MFPPELYSGHGVKAWKLMATSESKTNKIQLSVRSPRQAHLITAFIDSWVKSSH